MIEKNIENEIECPKCGREEKVKNEFNREKQRDKCKNCGCNYTGRGNGYPDYVKKRSIQYYFEGNGFRKIERLMYVSYVSVINWVKKAVHNIHRNREFKNKKVMVYIFYSF